MRYLIISVMALCPLSTLDVSAKEKAAFRKGCIVERTNGCVYLRSGQWTYELLGKDLPEANAVYEVRVRGTVANGSSRCSTRTTIGAIQVKRWSVLQGICK
jgi:hypothetical protein